MITFGKGKRIVIKKKEEKNKKIRVEDFNAQEIISELDEMKKNTDLIQKLRNHNNSLMHQKNIVGGVKSTHFIISEK